MTHSDAIYIQGVKVFDLFLIVASIIPTHDKITLPNLVLSIILLCGYNSSDQFVF